MARKTGQGARAVTVPVTAAPNTVTIITSPCRLRGWSLSSLGAPSTEADASVTSPAALATIATTVSLPAGDYNVQWSVELEGTVAAAVDNDNFQLRANAATIATSLNQGAVGSYPQQSVLVKLTAAGAISVRANILATVGAVYRAIIVATPVIATAAQIMDSQQVLGVFGTQDGSGNTVTLGNDGIYVSTGLSVQVITGTISGCLYVTDFEDY